MLVYANVLQLEGNDAKDVCLRAIHGWLTEQIGLKLPISELTRPGEWKGDSVKKSAWLRTYASTSEEPEMYAWRLKHADDKVSGRQWLVEIGLKHENGITDLSCTVNTDELSVLIRDPVTASRPRLIRYLLSNIREAGDARFSRNTPGVLTKTIGESQDSYRALLADIERSDRDYPIIIVSNVHSGQFLVDPAMLQENLIGLAQVVRTHPNYDSWEMESILGRHYSAWDGAITIVKPANRRGFCHASNYLSATIESWGASPAERMSELLGLITHVTNVPKQRSRVRPDGVARLELIRRLARQRRAVHENGPSAEREMISLLEDGLAELSEQNRELQERILQQEISILELQEENEAVKDELRAERFTSKQLRLQTQTSRTPTKHADLVYFLDLACRPSEPSPRECLDAISRAYPGRVVVLESAFSSANEYAQFAQGRRLLHLLRKLASEFIDAMIEGGDELARRCFTNSEYAATESQSTQNNREMRARRTFKYNGRDVPMWRHLKIGVADDQRRSIRVYFEWVSDERKVIIGHCGEHLPVISH